MQPNLLIVIAGVFVATALLSGLAVQSLLFARTPARRRLRELGQTGAVDMAPESVRLTDRPNPFWSRMSRLVPKSPKDMSRLQRRLAGAGYRGTGAPVVFWFSEVLAVVLFGSVALYLFGISAWNGRIAVATAAIVGYFLPGLFVDRKVAIRRKQIRQGIPDVLDLLVVCLEAGSSLDQAIVKASEDLQISYPALADEMRILNTETRAGKPRLEAFRNFAQRTKVEDVRALVAMLVQTDRFGTSISQTLRTFAKALRTKRRQLAEERANKVGVKLVFPLVFFLFPAFYVVVLGPAVIKFIRVLFQQFFAQ
jgi:tight adherence protein C